MAIVENKAEKKTGRIALGWFGNHVMGVFLCCLINLSLGLVSDTLVWNIFIGCISLIIYVLLIGLNAWQLGNQDRNRVKFGRREKDLWRGLKLGLLMSIPMFGFGIALILANAELLPNFYVIYKVCNSYVMPFINIIDGTVFGVLSAYLTEVSWGAILIVVSFNIIPCIVTTIYYALGFKEITFMDKIIYKKKTEA